MIFWKIAFRNVKKNWRHSLSALLSISASFVSLVLFDGYIEDLKSMYQDSFRHRSMLGDFIIENPDIHSKAGVAEPWKFEVTEEEQGAIDSYFAERGDVKNRVRFVNFSGTITNGMQSTIFIGRGIDVIDGERVRGKNWSWNTTFGKPLHLAPTAGSALLGQGLARKMGCSWVKPENFYVFSGGYEPVERAFECPTKDLQISTMTSSGQLNALDVNVVGLMDAGYRDIDDRYLVTSLETAQAITNSKNVAMISVELSDEVSRSQFVSDFNNHFKSLYPKLKIMTWVEHPVGETYLRSLDILSVFRNFVVIVILIISVLSVINTLIKIIKERSREIGTLRSIGFNPMQVVTMFIYETFLLAILGIGIGILTAILLTLALNGLHIRYKAGMLSEPVLFKISIDAFDYLRAFAVLICVSVLACLYSTRQELRKKVVDNFSHV